MNGRVEKLSTRSSRAKLSRASQEQLLDAALSQGAGTPVVHILPTRQHGKLTCAQDTHNTVEKKLQKVLLEPRRQSRQRADGRGTTTFPDTARKPTAVQKTPDIEYSPPKRANQVENDVDDVTIELGSRKQAQVALKPLRLTRKNLRLLDKMTKSSKCRVWVRPPLPADTWEGSVSSSGPKRESSHGSAKSFWTKDEKTGRYFYVHSDGKVS